MATRTWRELIESDPEHSRRYIKRWADLVAEGMDIDGEARLIDAMAPREARILDAGCGQGRTSGHLAARGHRVTGVDLDPVLVDAATAAFPDADFHAADLAEGDYPEGPFDLIVSAGNVLAFVEPARRRDVLAQLGRRLAGGGEPGRLVIGMGLDRGWSLADFEADAEAAGLSVSQRFSTWDLRPYDDDGFVVAVLIRR